MLKKHPKKETKNNINIIFGRNTYTDYNNNLKSSKKSFKDKININNNNIKTIHSLFESPSVKNSSNIDSNYPYGLSYQAQENTQPYIHSLSPVQVQSTNSTDFSHIKIKNSKQILKKLLRTISKIKKKNEINSNSKKDEIHKNKIYLMKKANLDKKKLRNTINNKHTFSKTSMGLRLHKKMKLEGNEKDKNKYKELRFKVHNTIKSNSHPLCNNFINKAHLFNEKILEYYQSDHYIKVIRNFENHFHYKSDLEVNPKIKMYTDIKSLEKASKTNKLDFKKCFSEKEQNLILLDPSYYFQKDNPDNFINVNIVKKKSLAERIKEEEEQQQIKQLLNNVLNKNNIQQKRNSLALYEYNALKNEEKQNEKKLMSKVNRILSDNKIKTLNSKKIKKLELGNLTTSKSNKNINKLKNDDNYDFFKSYKAYEKDSRSIAMKMNKEEEEIKKKRKKYIINFNNKIKKFIIRVNSITNDKALEKRAKDKMYYDRVKDANNKFHIVTKQMLADQNYEHLSKLKRKILMLNENEKNKEYELEDEQNNVNNKENKDNKENDLDDIKEKKIINKYVNKIKLIYKHQ
jgi:hypothetical protein